MEKRPRGRPSKYSDEKKHFACGMAAMGATDEQICEKLGICKQTLYNWYEEYPDLVDSVKKNKQEMDEKVEKSLFQLATGYEYDAEKPMAIGVEYGKTEIQIAKYREKVPPNTTAMIFWLKNRQPAKWRDKQELEHSGEIGVTIIDDIGKTK